MSSTPYPNAISFDIQKKLGESPSVYDYGALSTASSAVNGAAFVNAFAAACKYGQPLLIPEKNYTIPRLLLGTQQQITGVCDPIMIFSNAGKSLSTAPNGVGTVLTCDGTFFGAGNSWLPGVLNFGIASGSAFNTTIQFPHIRLKGIAINVASGVTGLQGFAGANWFDLIMEDCGLVTNSAGAWSAGLNCNVLTKASIKRFFASYAAAGISTDDPAATGISQLIDIEEPLIQNCATGIAATYTSDIVVHGGTIQNCTNGFIPNGPRWTVRDVDFIGNTGLDIDPLTVNPGGGSPAWITSAITPDQGLLDGNKFRSNVTISSNNGGTTVGPNSFLSSSKLIIASSGIDYVQAQLAFPPGGVSSTHNLEVFQLTTPALTGFSSAPSNGYRGQILELASNGNVYICTQTGGTFGGQAAATWVQINSGGGSTPGVWTAVTPSVTFTGGTATVTTNTGRFSTFGKQTLFLVHIEGSLSSGTINQIDVTPPATPFSISTPAGFAGGGQAVISRATQTLLSAPWVMLTGGPVAVIPIDVPLTGGTGNKVYGLTSGTAYTLDFIIPYENT